MDRKFIQTSLLALCCTIFTYGQGTFEKTYPTTYDKTSRDVVSTGDGYILVGMTNTSNLYDCDLCVMKTDNAGNQLWMKTYGGNKPDYAYDIEETGDGNYFVVGFTQSFGGGDMDVYLLKMNPAGDKIWEKTYIGFGNDEGREIIRTADGKFVIVGTTNSNISSQDAFLMKIDGDGTVDWIKYYGGSDKEFGNSVKLCSDGGFILTGQTYSYGQGGDTYLVRTNSAGTMLWEKFYGGSGSDEGVSVLANDDGSYTFAVRDSSSGNDVDVRVMKVSAAGDVVLFNKTFSGSQKDTPKTIVSTSDGGYLVGAISRSFGWVNPDMWLIKLSGSGDSLWTRHFGSSDHEHCHAAKQSADGGYLAIGHSRSWSPGQKIYFLKLNSAGAVSVEERMRDELAFNIFPNPSTNGEMNIVFGSTGPSTIKVSNATGQLIYFERVEAVVPGETRLMNIKHLPGVYFLSLESEKSTVTKKIVLN
jgi:hypothetical protein